MQNPLVLIPTDFERRLLESGIRPAIERCGGTLQLCGFGPVAAAARTSQLIIETHPKHVLLVGIAGAISNRLPVGTAWTFDSVACYGIGAGQGTDFITAGNLGWDQWPGDEGAAGKSDYVDGDRIQLSNYAGKSTDESCNAGLLLTSCSCSISSEEVAEKVSFFPNATAEDMEGFGVALACSLKNVPLTIVRGISNHAGDRDKSRWQIDTALNSAAELVSRLIAIDSSPS